MKTTFKFLLFISTIALISSCNSNSDNSFGCGSTICEETAGGDYDSMEECQLACHAGSGVTDADGNTYGTIMLGTQEWTMSNLNVATYRNGDPIPQVQDFATWQDLTTGAWCYYENNSANGPVYGRMYNWYAVNDPRGLAPAGWHVASDEEWGVMIDLFGGTNEAGGALKATGTTLWADPNEGATNASGFTALPGGRRDSNLDFGNMGEVGKWWTSTEHSAPFAKSRTVDYDSDAALGGYYGDKNNGYSVRCVKD
jgi:uncharacterized protein (TIGR02145 family)